MTKENYELETERLNTELLNSFKTTYSEVIAKYWKTDPLSKLIKETSDERFSSSGAEVDSTL